MTSTSPSYSPVVAQERTKPSRNTDVDIRAPPFCRERVTLWFAQVELQFRHHGIDTEETKFYRVVPLIDINSAGEVEDLIITPPLIEPYTTLKTALIARFPKLKEAKLLDEESLRGRTPSQYMRHLKALVPNIDEDVLKARWMSHLPTQTQACLKVLKSASLIELAEYADGIQKVFQPSTVASTSTAAPVNLQQQIDALAKQVAQLTTSVSNMIFRTRARSNNRLTSRERSRSRSKHRKIEPTTSTCWYHITYGNNAKHCVPGCKFPGNLNKNR